MDKDKEGLTQNDADCADERMKELIDNWVVDIFIPGTTEEEMQEISAIKADVPDSIDELDELSVPIRIILLVNVIIKQVPQLAKYNASDIWGYFQLRIQEACDYGDEDDLEKDD